MSAIILDGELVHYEVLGRGRPIIFLHGWVGSWRYWIPSMQATSTSFRTYALDFWGFGDTTNQVSNYGIDHQVDLLDNFVTEMGMGKIAIVGHGLGAIAGMLFANKYPPAVDRLMAISLPFHVNNIAPRLRNNAIPELVDWLLSRDPVSEAARVEAPKTDLRALHNSIDSLGEINLRGHSLQLTTPSLFVYGQNDPAISKPSAEHLDGLAENTHRIIFSESGHFPMLEEASKFNRLLTDFLALQSGESPRQLQLKEEWKRRVR